MKSVRIAELKSRLSEYLRAVRNGETIAVFDRETPVAQTSVILRLALGQPNGLTEWSKIQRGVSSALVATESLRTLDRLRLRAKLSDVEVATRGAAILALVSSLELVELDAAVLDRASQPMPTDLGTLDALHLATALPWKEMTATQITMATHDEALGVGAKARLVHRRTGATNSMYQVVVVHAFGVAVRARAAARQILRS